MLLAPLARAENAVELMDLSAPFPELSGSLDAIARFNGLFGGRRVTLRHVRGLLRRLPPDRPITVLDVGTGAADIPVALVRWARRAGRVIRVLALDRDAMTLSVARRYTDGYPEIALIQGDALSLPVRPESVDVVISALALHHFEPEQAMRHLAELDAAASLGWVVNDLVRSRAAYALVWVITRLLTRSRMAQHDGPLSVLRSYTPGETAGLCEKAGLFDVRIVAHAPLMRQCAVRGKA